MVIFIYDYCNIEFKTSPSRSPFKNHFCSRKCSRKYKEEKDNNKLQIMEFCINKAYKPNNTIEVDK